MAVEPYPVNLILRNKAVVVIGGGKIAERKILGLLGTGAKITVVAPRATRKIKALAAKKEVTLKLRNFMKEDLKGSQLVFVATDTEELNKEISRLARERRILVNCVDQPEECDFFVPSFFRRGSLMITISTGGKLPALARHLRKELEHFYSPVFEKYVKLLAEARKKIYQQNALSFSQKKELIENLIQSELLSILKQGGKKPAKKFIREFLQKNL